MDIDKIIKNIEEQHPYKKAGDRDSYSKYNEGWSDACDILGNAIKREIECREGRKLNAPGNWMIFVVVQRILGFPFFLALATFGVIILLIKYMANYVQYGGEAIAYTEKTRRKMIDDVFHKLVEQQK